MDSFLSSYAHGAGRAHRRQASSVAGMYAQPSANDINSFFSYVQSPSPPPYTDRPHPPHPPLHHHHHHHRQPEGSQHVLATIHSSPPPTPSKRKYYAVEPNNELIVRDDPFLSSYSSTRSNDSNTTAASSSSSSYLSSAPYAPATLNPSSSSLVQSMLAAWGAAPADSCSSPSCPPSSSLSDRLGPAPPAPLGNEHWSIHHQSRNALHVNTASPMHSRDDSTLSVSSHTSQRSRSSSLSTLPVELEASPSTPAAAFSFSVPAATMLAQRYAAALASSNITAILSFYHPLIIYTSPLVSRSHSQIIDGQLIGVAALQRHWKVEPPRGAVKTIAIGCNSITISYERDANMIMYESIQLCESSGLFLKIDVAQQVCVEFPIDECVTPTRSSPREHEKYQPAQHSSNSGSINGDCVVDVTDQHQSNHAPRALTDNFHTESTQS